MLAANLQPLEPYPGGSTPWRYRCIECSYEGAITRGNVTQGHGCRGCGVKSRADKRRLSHDQAAEIMLAAGVEPTEPYTSNNVPWPCVCLTCGRNVAPSRASVCSGQGACKFCARTAREPEEAAEAMRAYGVEPVVAYPGTGKPWASLCMRCGRTVSPRLSGLDQGQGACVYCAPNAPVSAQEAEADMRAAGFEPLEAFRGTMYHWRSRCTACNKESTPTLHKVRIGRGCRYCARYGLQYADPAVLYVLHHARLEAVKVGITNVGTTRLRGFQQRGWIVVGTLPLETGAEALRIEQAVLRHIRKEMELPPYLTETEMDGMNGWTETTGAEALPPSKLWELVRRFAGADDVSLPASERH